MHNSGSCPVWKVPQNSSEPPITRGVQAGDETARVTSEVPLDFRGCDPVMVSGCCPDLELCPGRWVICSFHNKWGASWCQPCAEGAGGVEPLLQDTCSSGGGETALKGLWL